MSTIAPGDHWTFTHPSGASTDYTVVNPNDPEQMPDGVRQHLWAKWEDELQSSNFVYLLNPDTGKYAMVTYGWLRRLPEADGSGWKNRHVA